MPGLRPKTGWPRCCHREPSRERGSAERENPAPAEGSAVIATYLLLLCGLVFWVAVAWAMLAAMPEDALDWRDQIAFAFWPVTFALLLIEWIWRRLFRQKRVPHIEALDLRRKPAPPAHCQGSDAAASPSDLGAEYG